MAVDEHFWIFLGMMGSGKSTLGKRVADLSKRDFFETDLILEERLKKSIFQVFQEKGEVYFRAQESAVLMELYPQPGVLSTGGGIVGRTENWNQMRRLGTTVFLDLEPLILKKRLRNERKVRPLLHNADWELRFDQLYRKRRSLYMQADVRIQLEHQSVDEAACEIIKKMKCLR